MLSCNGRGHSVKEVHLPDSMNLSQEIPRKQWHLSYIFRIIILALQHIMYLASILIKITKIGLASISSKSFWNLRMV